MELDTIEVAVGDQPEYFFRLKERLPDGSVRPYSLVGIDGVSLLGKVDKDDDDVDAVFTSSGDVTEDGSTVGATYSEVKIQLPALATTAERVLYGKLVVTKSSRPDTVKRFYLDVVNA